MLGADVRSLLSEESLTGRIVQTVVVFAVLVLGAAALYRSGGVAKERLNARTVEVIEAMDVALAVGVATGALVLIWDVPLPSGLLGPRTVNLVVQALVSVLVLIGAYWITGVARSVITRSTSDLDGATDHRRETAFHVVQVSIYAFAALLVLGIFRVNLTNLLIGAGFLGVIIGLAARQALAAVLAGFVLLFARPFKVGDWVAIEDREGVVTDITIFNTQLRTHDDEYVMIPNDQVTSNEVLNRSKQGRMRVTAEVGVDYDTDPTRALRVASEALRGVGVAIHDPEPHAVLKRFGDSSIVVELRLWIDDPSAPRMWRARSEAIEAVKTAFDEAGITIPFPQRTLGAREEFPAEAVAGRDPVTPDGGRTRRGTGDRPAAPGDRRGDGDGDPGVPTDDDGDDAMDRAEDEPPSGDATGRPTGPTPEDEE